MGQGWCEWGEGGVPARVQTDGSRQVLLELLVCRRCNGAGVAQRIWKLSAGLSGGREAAAGHDCIRHAPAGCTWQWGAHTTHLGHRLICLPSMPLVLPVMLLQPLQACIQPSIGSLVPLMYL